MIEGDLELASLKDIKGPTRAKQDSPKLQFNLFACQISHTLNPDMMSIQPQALTRRPDTPRPLGLAPPSYSAASEWYVFNQLGCIFSAEPNGGDIIFHDPLTGTTAKLTAMNVVEMIHYNVALKLDFVNAGPAPNLYYPLATSVNIHLPSQYKRRFTIVSPGGRKYKSDSPVQYANFFPIDSGIGRRFCDCDLYKNAHARYPCVPTLMLPPPVYSPSDPANQYTTWQPPNAVPGPAGRDSSSLRESKRKESKWGKRRKEFRDALTKKKVSKMAEAEEIEMAKEDPAQVSDSASGANVASMPAGNSSALEVIMTADDDLDSIYN
ncbi:hypothetical protein AAF712_009150 [Marasmius tenuissimus]|uniref:Uncharacterized protein n=1 Tax=Marasmius tenuissimus TaxID=585030 RepID=A0ABR2ZQK6_9AGAR